jgi:phosphate starvation-inducible membrane PsiE
MAVGIFIAIASIVGIIYGIIKKNKPLVILSVAALMMTIAVWVYFYNNPY